MKKLKIIFPLLLVIAISIFALTACPNGGYSVTFNANGGTGGPERLTNVTSITAEQAVPAPTRDGNFTFGGWATSATGTTAVSFPHTISRNITLYAIWNATGFEVTFNANGGTGAPGNLTNVTSVTAAQATAPTRTNYRFEGWAATAAGTTAVEFPLTIAANTALYAIWTPVIIDAVYGSISGSSAWYNTAEHLEYTINGDVIDVELRGGANMFAVNFRQIEGVTLGTGVGIYARVGTSGEWLEFNVNEVYVDGVRQPTPAGRYIHRYEDQFYIMFNGNSNRTLQVRFVAANEAERIVTINVTYVHLQLVDTVYGSISGSSDWYNTAEYLEYTINGSVVNVTLRGGANRFAVNFEQIAGITLGTGVGIYARVGTEGAWNEFSINEVYDEYGNRQPETPIGFYIHRYRDQFYIMFNGDSTRTLQVRFAAANGAERIVTINVTYVTAD